MIMHSCVFAYWGWYWREVYHELPLIAAQVVFLYVLDMLVGWSGETTGFLALARYRLSSA